MHPLQSHQERLPLAAAQERIGDDVELLHGRSQVAGFIGQ
jgi:hypothetical protein